MARVARSLGLGRGMIRVWIWLIARAFHMGYAAGRFTREVGP